MRKSIRIFLPNKAEINFTEGHKDVEEIKCADEECGNDYALVKFSNGSIKIYSGVPYIFEYWKEKK